ncbi:MAG: hypothetical protein ACI835_003913 [Planctomycetota bacterium]
MVGAPRESENPAELKMGHGVAYLFQFIGGTWTELNRLSSQTAPINKRFGGGVMSAGTELFNAAPDLDSQLSPGEPVHRH